MPQELDGPGAAGLHARDLARLDGEAHDVLGAQARAGSGGRVGLAVAVAARDGGRGVHRAARERRVGVDGSGTDDDGLGGGGVDEDVAVGRRAGAAEREGRDEAENRKGFHDGLLTRSLSKAGACQRPRPRQWRAWAGLGAGVGQAVRRRVTEPGQLARAREPARAAGAALTARVATT